METQRIQLASILATRDATMDKDGLLSNCYQEETPIGTMIVKRPGLEVSDSLGVGCAQGAITYEGQAIWIKSDTLWTSGAGIPTLSSFSAAATPANTFALTRGGSLVSQSTDLYYICPDTGPAVAVYKSTNNGTSWALISTPWVTVVLGNCNCAVSFGGALYFAGVVTARGVYKSSDNGVNWSLLTADLAGGGSLNVDALIVHNSKLYAFLSGNAALPQIWYSSDGITWTAANSGITGLTGRIRPGFVSLNNRLYIIAGGTSNTSVNNDVWVSSDNGFNWLRLVSAASFTARVGLTSWVTEGRMWIAGGATAAGFGSAVNDVWSSADGSAWIQAAASAAWSARHSPAYCLHNSALYIGPGITSAGAIATGVYFATPTVASSVVLSPAPATLCEPFQLTLIPATATTSVAIFLKSSEVAYYYNGLSVVQITDGDYPSTTVYGVVYLDGYIFVMTPKGIIHGSDLAAPTAWSALNFISANAEADAGVALVRQLNYVVALKAYSTEFFYNAGNATGSPLGKVLNALLEIGCAASGSIAFADNTFYFMANSRQKGRSIMKMEGYTPKYISNAFVDRVLNADDLSEVYSFVVKTNGHFFYVLTLIDSALTLVFDEVTGLWHRWTRMEEDSPLSVSTAVVQTSGTILVTMPAPHGQADGNVVTIAGATPVAANGQYNLRYDPNTMSSAQFSYVPATAVSGAITGSITATFFTETFFPGVYYSYGDGEDLMLDRETGDVYTFSPTIYQDDGNPINLLVRTTLFDVGTMAVKRYNRLEIVGDRVTTTLQIRTSDDDYDSWSLYRPVAIQKNRAMISNLGSARRRAHEFRHTGNVPLRIAAAEVDFDIGAF